MDINAEMEWFNMETRPGFTTIVRLPDGEAKGLRLVADDNDIKWLVAQVDDKFYRLKDDDTYEEIKL